MICKKKTEQKANRLRQNCKFKKELRKRNKKKHKNGYQYQEERF